LLLPLPLRLCLRRRFARLPLGLTARPRGLPLGTPLIQLAQRPVQPPRDARLIPGLQPRLATVVDVQAQFDQLPVQLVELGQGL
jgi:hypothetical protein